MKIFEFDVTFQTSGNIEVEANSLEEAKEKVRRMRKSDLNSNMYAIVTDVQVWESVDDDNAEPFYEL